ncbi:sugar ABC transporter ATP-binding protein [Alkalibacterium iburiense]|uniref:Ribose/galactose/methyl galactoside import ATP-binding protein n=1 Tax=Alkalibacterium iburiense TaxID=290589 RepID=A0ABN0X595_9LACT
MIQTKQSIIEMQDISIEFPGVKALSNVDFDLKTGTINALIGANGAGKSTLMKILSGAHNHYTGNIRFDGEEVTIRKPKDAKDIGIDIVYQEVDVSLVPYLSVGENIMLDEIVNHMGKNQIVGWKKIHQEAKKVLKELNVELHSKTLVSELTLAEKQMVLIARALVRKGKYLILDEPTAPLSNSETEELFRVVRKLAYEKNVGIVFISHRIPELFEICERITIMRNGKVVDQTNISSVTPDKVIESMLGKTNSEVFSRKKTFTDKKILDIRNLTNTKRSVIDVNINVRSGEIVGIAGLVGAGKTELCKTIFGAEKVVEGEILLDGVNTINKTPSHAVKNGFALVPEERRKEGVLVDEPVYTNLTSASLNKYVKALSTLAPKNEKKEAIKMIKSLGIKTPSENQNVALLSGGNQQKVAIGKWLMSDAEIYLFDEPTKGVDVGAKTEIYSLISDLASQNKGIIYATSELDEIMKITDRVYVIYDNKIVKELNTDETSEEELLYYSTGGSK